MARQHLIRSTIGLAVAAALAACTGGTERLSSPPPTETPPTNPSTDALVKDVVVSSLPSPYYHFDYDATGAMTGASFASGLLAYSLAYVGSRLTEMRNSVLVNGDKLTYAYDAVGRVANVKYANAAGITFTIVFFGYDGQHLTTLERDRLVDRGWIVDKTMSFTDGADGNVSDVTEHHPAIAGEQDETTVTDHYADYDSGINVDGFDLLHTEFFDHLVLLPQVQLQRSNPRTVTRAGDGQTYRVQYAYVYDARNRPLSKNGVITILNGPAMGQQIQSATTFTYY